MEKSGRTPGGRDYHASRRNGQITVQVVDNAIGVTYLKHNGQKTATRRSRPGQTSTVSVAKGPTRKKL